MTARSTRFWVRHLVVLVAGILAICASLLPVPEIGTVEASPAAADGSVTQIWSTGRRSVHIRVQYSMQWVAFFDGSLRSDAWVYLKENRWMSSDRNLAMERQFGFAAERIYDFDVEVKPEWFDGKNQMKVFAETLIVFTQERYRSPEDRDVMVYR